MTSPISFAFLNQITAEYNVFAQFTGFNILNNKLDTNIFKNVYYINTVLDAATKDTYFPT